MSEETSNNQSKRLKEIKGRHKGSLLKLPNVTGVGIGFKKVKGERTEEICIRVYVSQKLPIDQLKDDNIIPREIDGIKTDVIIGDFEIQSTPISTFRSLHDPMIGGIGIINYTVYPASNPNVGTLGGTAFDNETGIDMILSNWHVLNAGGQIGDDISQPGSWDGGIAEDIVANLHRSVLSARVDAAIANINGQRYLDQDIIDIGRFQGTITPTLGMKVHKSGRTTGYTEGEIVDVDADLNIRGYPGGTRLFENQIFVESITNNDFSDGGDSGSLVLNYQNQVVGLLFAGGGGHTVCNRISHVISELDIDIDHGVTIQDMHSSVTVLNF